MAIRIGTKVKLKDITEEEMWSMCLARSIWNSYKHAIFTVVERPHYKSKPGDYYSNGSNIIYIITQDNFGTSFCWWVDERFVTPVQAQLTFVFTE